MDGQHNASATTVGDARRAQIVHAARAICLEKGFSKITISDIAGQIAVSASRRRLTSSAGPLWETRRQSGKPRRFYSINP